MLKGLKKLVGPKTDDELQIQKYKSILQERSDPSPELHLKIGRLYEKIGEKSNASLEYKQAARIYMAREEYVGALVANKSIILIDRKDADALANVAFIELQQGVTLSAQEFKSFLQDIGQPLRAAKQGQDPLPKTSSSRLALSRDNRRRNTEEDNPNFKANRQQLIDLISGDSAAEERFDASFDAERHSLVNSIRQEFDAGNIPDKNETTDAVPPPQTANIHDGLEEMMSPIDLHRNEVSDEDIPFIDLTQDVVSEKQALVPEAKEPTSNARDLLSRLGECPFFSKQSGPELEQLRRHVQLRQIAEDTPVAQKNNGQQGLLVILEGSVELRIERPESGRDTDVLLLQTGDFWGEHAFLGQSGLKLSALAKTFCTIVEIPKTVLTVLVKKHPSLLDQLKKICKRRCFSSFLRHVELFKEFTTEEIEDVAEHLFTKEMKKGSTLIHEGEHGESIFLIESGKVEVHISFVEREELQVLKMEMEHLHLAYLQEGDFFGEGAYFSKEPRSATIVALTDGRLLKLPASHLQKLIHDYPRFKAVLQQYHQQRIKATMKTVQAALIS